MALRILLTRSEARCIHSVMKSNDWTQDQWSRYWFDHVCQRREIPPHEEQMKLLMVDLEEQIRFLIVRVERLEQRRWWQFWRM